MITEVVGGAGLTWTFAGTGGDGAAKKFDTTVANITWCDPVAIASAQEVGLHVTMTGARNAFLRFQYAPHDAASKAALVWSPLVVQENPTLAGVVRTYAVSIKEIGPITLASYPDGIYLPLPVASGFVRVGVYSSGVPLAGDSVTLKAIRQPLGQVGSGA